MNLTHSNTTSLIHLLHLHKIDTLIYTYVKASILISQSFYEGHERYLTLFMQIFSYHC